MWNKKECYFFFSLVFAFLFLFFLGEGADHFWPHQHVLHAPKEKVKENKVLIVEWLCYGIPFARLFCHVHFTFFPGPLCQIVKSTLLFHLFDNFAKSTLWVCQVHIAICANLAILIFERALPLKLQRANQVPKKAKENKWEREGRKRGGRGRWEECHLWKNKIRGSVIFWGRSFTRPEK